MVTVEEETTRQDGVTYVRATVENPHRTPQRVRIESRLDGPTWPPRRGSVTDPDWANDCWEAVVAPGSVRGLGFASPAEPTDPVLEAVSVERADPEDAENTEHVLASLGDWGPPSDVLTEDD